MKLYRNVCVPLFLLRGSIALYNCSSGLGSPKGKELLISILEHEILWAKSWKWENHRHVPGRESRLLIVAHKAGKRGKSQTIKWKNTFLIQ